MHGSAAGASVYSGRRNQAGVWCKSQPSQHQRLSENQSQVQARISQVHFWFGLDSICLNLKDDHI